MLSVVLALVFIAGALAAFWLDRYQLGQAGGIPVRMNRLTGEVIGCLPKGCFSIIPPGEPPLKVIAMEAPPPAPAASASAGAVGARTKSPAEATQRSTSAQAR